MQVRKANADLGPDFNPPRDLSNNWKKSWS